MHSAPDQIYPSKFFSYSFEYLATVCLIVQMDQREIWLDELQTEPEGSDPTRFIVGLVPKGVNGGKDIMSSLCLASNYSITLRHRD